jgi:hypothetical protein
VKHSSEEKNGHGAVMSDKKKGKQLRRMSDPYPSPPSSSSTPSPGYSPLSYMSISPPPTLKIDPQQQQFLNAIIDKENNGHKNDESLPCDSPFKGEENMLPQTSKLRFSIPNGALQQSNQNGSFHPNYAEIAHYGATPHEPGVNNDTLGPPVPARPPTFAAPTDMPEYLSLKAALEDEVKFMSSLQCDTKIVGRRDSIAEMHPLLLS